MTYEFSWLLFLSFYYYYYFTCGCGYLIPCLALSVRATLIPLSMKSSSLRLIQCTFILSFPTISFFSVTHLLSFDQSRTIFQQMPAVSPFFSFPFSFVTSITGSGPFLPLLLSHWLYSLWFSFLFSFSSLLFTLCLYS